MTADQLSAGRKLLGWHTADLTRLGGGLAGIGVELERRRIRGPNWIARTQSALEHAGTVLWSADERE